MHFITTILTTTTYYNCNGQSQLFHSHHFYCHNGSRNHNSLHRVVRIRKRGWSPFFCHSLGRWKKPTRKALRSVLAAQDQSRRMGQASADWRRFYVFFCLKILGAPQKSPGRWCHGFDPSIWNKNQATGYFFYINTRYPPVFGQTQGCSNCRAGKW